MLVMYYLAVQEGKVVIIDRTGFIGRIKEVATYLRQSLK